MERDGGGVSVVKRSEKMSGKVSERRFPLSQAVMVRRRTMKTTQQCLFVATAEGFVDAVLSFVGHLARSERI